MNFVVSGAFEFYAEDQHGRSIIGFLTTCNFCSPIYNFFSRQPSTEGVLCVEEGYGLRISLDHFILLMQRPDFAAFFRHMNHHLLDYYSQRIKAFQAMSARERYEVLLKEKSGYIQSLSIAGHRALSRCSTRNAEPYPK